MINLIFGICSKPLQFVQMYLKYGMFDDLVIVEKEGDNSLSSQDVILLNLLKPNQHCNCFLMVALSKLLRFFLDLSKAN